MSTKPRLKRKTRGKKQMPSKELLLVRLHMSGLGLEPRWLLNRLQFTLNVIVKILVRHVKNIKYETCGSSPARF